MHFPTAQKFCAVGSVPSAPLKKNSNKFQIFEIIRAVDMQSVAQSSNMYSYCINNPINNVDPNGTYLISGTLLLKGAAVIAGAFMTSVLLVDLNQKVGDVLKTRKGSIKNAPKPPGTPGWDMVRDLTMAEIYRRAQKGDPGFKTLWKLLNDGRFKK